MTENQTLDHQSDLFKDISRLIKIRDHDQRSYIETVLSYLDSTSNIILDAGEFLFVKNPDSRDVCVYKPWIRFHGEVIAYVAGNNKVIKNEENSNYALYYKSDIINTQRKVFSVPSVVVLELNELNLQISVGFENNRSSTFVTISSTIKGETTTIHNEVSSSIDDIYNVHISDIPLVWYAVFNCLRSDNIDAIICCINKNRKLFEIGDCYDDYITELRNAKELTNAEFCSKYENIMNLIDSSDKFKCFNSDYLKKHDVIQFSILGTLYKILIGDTTTDCRRIVLIENKNIRNVLKWEVPNYHGNNVTLCYKLIEILLLRLAKYKKDRDPILGQYMTSSITQLKELFFYI